MHALISHPSSYISQVHLSIRRIVQGLKCAKGAHIGFAGAVHTDGPSAEVLSVTLPLCVPETDVELRTLAARHSGALKNAVFSLSQCYNQKSPGNLHSLPDARYPFKSSFTALHTSTKCRFEYLSSISCKLVFLAETENNEKVCQIRLSVFDGGPFNMCFHGICTCAYRFRTRSRRMVYDCHGCHH